MLIDSDDDASVAPPTAASLPPAPLPTSAVVEAPRKRVSAERPPLYPEEAVAAPCVPGGGQPELRLRGGDAVAKLALLAAGAPAVRVVRNAATAAAAKDAKLRRVETTPAPVAAAAAKAVAPTPSASEAAPAREASAPLGTPALASTPSAAAPSPVAAAAPTPTPVPPKPTFAAKPAAAPAPKPAAKGSKKLPAVAGSGQATMDMFLKGLRAPPKAPAADAAAAPAEGA